MLLNVLTDSLLSQSLQIAVISILQPVFLAALIAIETGENLATVRDSAHAHGKGFICSDMDEERVYE